MSAPVSRRAPVPCELNALRAPPVLAAGRAALRLPLNLAASRFRPEFVFRFRLTLTLRPSFRLRANRPPLPCAATERWSRKFGRADRDLCEFTADRADLS